MIRMISVMAAVGAMFVPAVANASSIYFSLSNQTPVAVDNVLYSPCGKSAAPLASVPANSESSKTLVSCGFSSGVSFDYAGGDKKCRYSIIIVYNSQFGYMPNGGASSAGAVPAVCKVVFLGGDNSGNYGFVATMK